MKDELQQKLVDALDKMLNGIDSGVAFMSEQMPDYLQQLIMWFGIYSAIKCLVGVMLLVAAPLVQRKLYNRIPLKPKKDGAENWYWHDGYKSMTMTDLGLFYRLAVIGLPALSAVFGLALINLEWLQILIAPKVWLVEYISNLAV